MDLYLGYIGPRLQRRCRQHAGGRVRAAGGADSQGLHLRRHRWGREIPYVFIAGSEFWGEKRLVLARMYPNTK